MKIAINIDGQFGRMTGVQFYVDSLLDALYGLDTPHHIAAFMPAVWSPTLLQDAAARGGFAWLDRGHTRVDTAGSDCYLQNRPAIRRLHPKAPARVSAQLLDRRLIHPVKSHLPALTERAARRGAHRYDVLHTPGAARRESVTYSARRNVATVYDVTTRTHPQTHSADNIAMSELLFQYARDCCARILTISEFSKADIVAHLGIPADRVDVTPLAPRLGVRRLDSPCDVLPTLDTFGLREGPFVLYSGTLEPRKNLRRLVQAFAAVAHQVRLPGLKLALAGGSRQDHDRELADLTRALGVGDRVVFTGYVSGDQMNALMSACAVFAYVSEYEGFGLPPLEAMTCGAPVLVSNATSLPEVVGDAGLQVAPADTDGMAAALLALLSDCGLNARQRALSLARARQFSWERTAQLTLQTYEAAAS